MLWVPLALTGLYLLCFALIGHLPGRHQDQARVEVRDYARMALFVPAYKEDQVILDTVQNLLKQQYPREAWDLIVIADSMQPQTLDQLTQLPLTLIEVSFEKSTKAKALNQALATLPSDSYDLAVILDADNHAPPEFLTALNRVYQGGAEIIQVRRVAKARATPIAMLDAISEEVNNHIFCLAHRKGGLSSRLIGSGMAFRYQLFHDLMAQNKAIGGFDKELELNLMEAGYEVAYIHQATRVWDEKVSQAQTMKRQRLRWISAQYHYLKRYWLKAIQALVREGNVNLFDKTLQMLLVPRLILIGLTTGGMLTATLLAWLPYGNLWLMAWLSVVLAYLISIPKYLYSTDLLKAVAWLPVAIVNMLWALRKVGTANRSFIHTPHGVQSKQR